MEVLGFGVGVKAVSGGSWVGANGPYAEKREETVSEAGAARGLPSFISHRDFITHLFPLLQPASASVWQ